MKRLWLALVALVLISAFAAAVFLSDVLTYDGRLSQYPLDLFPNWEGPGNWVTVVNATPTAFNWTVYNNMEYTVGYDLLFSFYVNVNPVTFNCTSFDAVLRWRPNWVTPWQNGTLNWTPSGTCAWQAGSPNHTIGAWQTIVFEMWVTFTFDGEGDYIFDIHTWETGL